jgi:hypothetical protein
MPGDALNNNAKIEAGGGMWAGPDIKQAGNELDVWAVTNDGRLAHWWYRVDANRWYGPEYFG